MGRGGWDLWLHPRAWQLLARLQSVTQAPPYLGSLPGPHYPANMLHSERLKKKILQHYPHCLSTRSNSNLSPHKVPRHYRCALLVPRGPATEPPQQAGSPGSQARSPLPRPPAQQRLRLWERRPPRRERADLCWRKHLCSEGEGEPFPTISCSVRGPGAGVAARGLFFEAEPHIMRLLTGALRHRAKTQDGYLSINLTLHPLHFICLYKFGG